MMVAYSVVLFRSTNHAIRGEKLLKKQGLKVKLIPVPRHLSSDCGVCLRVLPADREVAMAVLDEAGVEVMGLHEL